MKNRGLIIALIILLSVIVVILTLFLVACLKNGFSFSNGIIDIGSKNSNLIFDKTFNLEDITSIDVKQDAGDIIFKEAANEEVKVVVYGENANDINVDLTENKLTIDYTTRNRFILFSFGNRKNDIIVYIPSSYSNDIKIKNDYGSCDITDLENATLNIDSDAGNVQVGKVKNAIVKCDYGNIEIKEILNKCDIKANCGNIEIAKISLYENSSIKADLGNVDIGEINDIYIDANVDLGKAIINKNNRSSDITLKISCDMGNITVEK